MKSLLVIFGMIVLCVSSVRAQHAAQLVSLVIHVDAGKRKPPAISKSDLLIFDNDAKVTAETSVESALKLDAVFAIVVDASGSNLDKVDFIRKYVLDIFDAAMVSPGSKALLFTFADGIDGGDTWVNRHDVQQAMRGFRVRQGAPSPLYAALIEAAKRLGEHKTASRRLLFVVTDGDDTSTGVTSQDAVNACLTAGVTVIPVGLLSYDREKLGRTNLANLADTTGGRAVVLDRPGDVKALVADVLNSEYVVSFAPTSAAGFHSVRMKLASAPKGVSLKTPKGYYAP